jgi:hypothetical protein
VYFVTIGTIAAIFAIALIVSTLLGYNWLGGPSWFGVALGLLTLVGLAYRSRTFLDRRPVVVLDANGIRDRRLVLPLPVIPWSRIMRAQVEAKLAWKVPRIGITLRLRENPDGTGPTFPYVIYIDLVSLDIDPRNFVEHIRRLAPQLPIDATALNME